MKAIIWKQYMAALRIDISQTATMTSWNSSYSACWYQVY